MCKPVQAVQADHIESRRIVEDSSIFGSQEESTFEIEVGAAAVHVPQPGLRAPACYDAGIKYQSARARQHEGRPMLRREPKYIRRQRFMGIVLYSE